MKGVILLVILITVISINLVSAEIILEPNPIDIAVKINQPTTFNISITNTYPFTIQSFEFTNLTGFNFPDMVLEQNETKSFNFDVEMSTLKSESIVSSVSFKYIVEIPEDPMTHNVELGLYGFNPSFLTIHEGDTVRWTNHDDISHSVTGSFFDHTLDINQSAQTTFTTVGQEYYQDLILFWAGTIQVLSRDDDEEVNNPSYDRVLRINLDVFSDPTDISLNVIEKSFTINHKQFSEGLLSLKNDGNEIAHKVKLTADSDWIVFKEDNFNIGEGSTNYVTFEIKPLIFSTNATNKTYDIKIKAKGLNTEEEVANISIFIPYKNIVIDETDPEYILRVIEVWCQEEDNKDNAFCRSPDSSNPNVIIRDPTIPINLTASEVYAMLKRIQRIEDSNQRTNNKLTALANLLETDFPEFALLLNSTYNKAEDSEDRRATNEAVFWIALIFAILIAGLLITWKSYEKWKHKQYLMGRDR